MKGKLLQMLLQYEAEITKLELVYGEDLMNINTKEISQGDCDTAYSIGYDHGVTYAKYFLIDEILSEFGWR